MTTPITLDTGVLIAVDRGERAVWQRFKMLTAQGFIPTVPSVVIAEAWRAPTQVRLARALKQCKIVPLDESLARRAGELSALSELDDPVDAIVVVTASANGGFVWSDDPHLRILADCLPIHAPSVTVRQFA